MATTFVIEFGGLDINWVRSLQGGEEFERRRRRMRGGEVGRVTLGVAVNVVVPRRWREGRRKAVVSLAPG